MIFITGDTHGTTDISKLLEITDFIVETYRQDEAHYIIVLGDFGYGWCPKTSSQMKDTFRLMAAERLNLTLLFIDGNHENHDYLATLSRSNLRYPDMGVVGVVPGTPLPVYHLLRGTHYTIQGHTFYALGGAHSHDIYYRTPPYYTKRQKVWWSAELPTADFLSSLPPVTQVDYILTHQAPQCYFPIDPTTRQPYKPDLREQNFLFHLNNLEYTCDYDTWFFGHWHIDEIMPTYSHKKGVALYNKVYTIDKGGKGEFM